MSQAKFQEFIKKMTTESSSDAANPTGTGAELARAFSELKDKNGEEKVQGAIEKFAAFAKSQGFDVTEADVKGYFDSLKTQYETNPMVATMLDSYCSSTCHIGSAVGGG